MTLANSLPSQVHTGQAFVSIVLYILKQTHEPLFRRDDGENYTSRILTKWTRNLDSTEFVLCPNQSLKFNEKTRFTVGLLYAQIDEITQKYDNSAVFKMDDACVKIRFSHARPSYLAYLSQYEAAPYVVGEGGFEDGLGLFRIEQIEKQKIVLGRKVPVRHGYNTILIRQYNKEADIAAADVADWNLLSGVDVPRNVEGEYQKFSNTELKTGNLIINHPDPAVRRLIYNCTNIDFLRHSFIPAGAEFGDVATVFPIGVPGAKQGMAFQDCSAARKAVVHKGGELIFANWRTDNDVQMDLFAKEFFKKTGMRIRLVRYPPADFKRMLHSRPRPYHLTIMHLDAVVPDYRAFVEVFFRKDGYLDFDLPKGAGYFGKMDQEEDSGPKRDLAMLVIAELSREAVALPLYQTTREFGYPKKIRNIVAGKGFIEYPEIGTFKW